MAYNKARAEKEWLEWKSDEETKLRKLGVDEDAIQRLHTYDWEAFKADRRYQERYQEWNAGENQLSEQPVNDTPCNIRNIEQLMDNIENEELFDALKATDSQTLQILIYKMAGYTGREIAHKMGLTEVNVKKKISRLRKRLKNIL